MNAVQAIPRAVAAIEAASTRPFVFLTNGGGEPESSRAMALSQMLSHQVLHSASQASLS